MPTEAGSAAGRSVRELAPSLLVGAMGATFGSARIGLNDRFAIPELYLSNPPSASDVHERKVVVYFNP